MTKPAITVVIPTFNRAKLVHCSIDSVLAQTYAPAEIIVVNDGSPDNTLEVLAGYGSKIRVVSQANAGLSAARNAGIMVAKSDWIAFLDDDDEYAPQRLAVAAEGIKKFPAAHVFGTNAAMIAPDGTSTDLWALRRFAAEQNSPLDRPLRRVLGGCFFAQSLVVRRTVLHDVGLFRKALYEDLDLFVRLVPHSPWIVDSRMSLRLIRRTETGPNLSAKLRQRPVERIQDLINTYRMALALPQLAPGEQTYVRQGLAARLFELGAALRERGESARASDCFAESARMAVSVVTRAKAAAAFATRGRIIPVINWLARRKPMVTR